VSVAIVTGGASGVGRATVDVLAARGVEIVAIDRAWPEDADDVGRGARRITGDVCDDATWRAAVDAAAELGDLSMLVINAARLVVGTVLEVDDDALRSVFEVNVFAAARALRACLPVMIEGGGGSVVAVASTDAMFAEQGLAAYCASKGALLQLVRCVAVDHARQGIRANVVCPGAIDTPFFRQHVDAAPDPAAFLRQKTERHPSGRILQPGDVAEVIGFLLSDAAVGMNGTPVMIDGALTTTFDFKALL
jgi:NAD(P)-dependent dehydrogenase (short-subunit alcohol dehydrogenase family)